jgi:hypothetical protein
VKSRRLVKKDELGMNFKHYTHSEAEKQEPKLQMPWRAQCRPNEYLSLLAMVLKQAEIKPLSNHFPIA